MKTERKTPLADDVKPADPIRAAVEEAGIPPAAVDEPTLEVITQEEAIRRTVLYLVSSHLEMGRIINGLAQLLNDVAGGKQTIIPPRSCQVGAALAEMPRPGAAGNPAGETEPGGIVKPTADQITAATQKHLQRSNPNRR